MKNEIIAAFAAVCTICGASAVSADELVYGSYLAPTHSSSKGITHFIDRARELSGGEINFEFFPSGAIASGKTTLSAISDGLMDGGMIVNIYFPSEMPVNTVLSDMSFWDKDNRVISAAITDTIVNDCEDCLNEFDQLGVHFLATYGTPPYQAMCSSDAENFTLQGKRVRVAGEDMGRWAQSIGAIPVNIPNNESYEAMERNQIDCVIGAVAWLKGLSLSEVTNTILELPMGSFQGGSLLNVSNNVWEGLSPENQSALEQSALEGVARTVYAYIQQEEDAREIAAEKGIASVQPDEALVAKRQVFQELQVTQAAETAASRGYDGGANVVQALIANIEKWEKIIAREDPDEGRYVELLGNIWADK